MATVEPFSGVSASYSDAEFLKELEILMNHELFDGTIPAKHDYKFEALGPAQGYSYKPLAAERVIRIFCLMAGNENDNLEGSLLHVVLDQNQRYEALSYVWGSQDKPCSISLPEGDLPNTKSLYTALIRLRRPGEKRRLWIDAICIDQANNIEKSQQILLMPRIYSTAFCVLAWLGEDEDNGEVALQLLEKIQQTDFSSLPARQVSAKWMRAHGLPSQDDPLWHALLTFWARPWFRRVWVVQEFVVARNVLMICGKCEISWKSLISGSKKSLQYSLVSWLSLGGNLDEKQVNRDAFAGSGFFWIMTEIKQSSHFSSAISNLVRTFSEGDLTDLQKLHEWGWDRVPGMQDLVMMLRENPDIIHETTDILENSVRGLLSLVEEHQLRFPLPTLNLLSVFEKSEATDPRDKLFALVGIAKDGTDNALRPDYNEPTEMVLLRYARSFVNLGQGIWMLYIAGIASRNFQVPSWVPDWTKMNLTDLNIVSIVARIGDAYAAASDVSPKVRLTEIQGELIISGSFLDGILRIARPPLFHNNNDEYGDLRELRTFFAKADDMVLHRGAYVTGEPLFEVQWRTLILNHDLRADIASEERGTEYRALRQAVDNYKPGDLISSLLVNGKNQCFQQILFLAKAYTLCETRSGLVGMVPRATQDGDKIFLFAG